MHSRFTKSLRILCLSGLAFIPFGSVAAEDNSCIESSSEAGYRTKLARRGFEYQAGFTGEYFGKLKGGAKSTRGRNYLGSMDASFTLNLSKARLGRGNIFVAAQHLHGRGINNGRVGAIQNPSGLDEAGFTKLTEAWYADDYLGGKLKLKAGRQYADSDFGTVESGTSFLNASYGLIPTNPMPTYPSPSTGVSLWTDPAAWLSIGTGLFRGEQLPEPSHTRSGPYALAEAQFRWIPEIVSHMAVAKIGIWQQNGIAWRTDSRGDLRPVRNHGLYGTAEYRFRKTSEDRGAGPGIFLQWGWTPADRNEISGYWGTGFTYKGLIPRQTNDTIGLGVTNLRGPDLRHETVVELFYSWQVTPAIRIQPDLQLVRHPGGTSESALLFGIRFAYRID